MTCRSVQSVWLPIAIAAQVLLPVGNSMGYEAACRVVTKWDAGCSGEERPSWDNMVLAWYNSICSPYLLLYGVAFYLPRGVQVNGNIVDSDFTDTQFASWGNDAAPGHPDAVDAFMLGMHGGNAEYNHRWNGSVRVNEAGDGNCTTWQGAMEFGDGDLEFLHLSSCFSMDKEDWWPEWSSSFDGLHEVDGFHGIMYIHSYYDRNYSDFVLDAFFTSISSSWIDNLYEWEVSDDYDQCPVSRNVGFSESDCAERMAFERYNNMYSDPPGSDGTYRYHRTKFIVDCNGKGKGHI